MTSLQHSVARLSLAVFTCLFPIHSTAAAMNVPNTQSINQPSDRTFVNNQACFFSARPKVSLPDDIRGKSYITSAGHNGLIDGNPHYAECWDILKLDDWLPLWFLEAPQCLPNATFELDCNEQDPQPEPWTTTFMRSAARTGDWNACSDIGNTNCQYTPDACLGNDDSPLLRARYKYVAYTISSTSWTIE